MSRAPSVLLVIARELASNAATPMFVVDSEGALVFYNEPAEAVLGQPFSETGLMSLGAWSSRWWPEDPDTGEKLALEDLPLGVALIHRRPDHRRLLITGIDGEKRTILVTAFPLFSRADELVGGVAIFWMDSQAQG